MVDPRVGVLAFYGDAWQSLVWVVAFVVLTRQAYGAWEDRRAWAAAGWVAGPLVLAGFGLASALVLLLSVPPVQTSPWVLGRVLSAVLAPVGMPLQLAAALLLASAPIAFWRVRPYAPTEAGHAAGLCVVLGVWLSAFAADFEVHRALWVHTDGIDELRIAQLHALAAWTGPLLGVCTAVCTLGAGAWCLPALRRSGRSVFPWVSVPAAIALAVYGVSALQAATLLGP